MIDFLLSCAVVLTTMLSSPTHAMFSGSRLLLKGDKERIHMTVRSYTKYPVSYNKQRNSTIFPPDEEGPEFYDSSKPLNFTRRAWWKVKPIYAQIKQHPFITELIAGSLPKDIFSFYIKQDYLFLIERARAMSIIASQSQTSHPKLASHLTILSDATKRGAAEIFEKYKILEPNEKTLIKSPACRAYTNYMLTVAAKGSLEEGFVALLPCTLIYQKIGEFAKQSSPPTNDYQKWIESYSSLERQNRVVTLLEFADELADQSSFEDLNAMEAVFQKASLFELDFWDDAYHKKTLKIKI